MFSFDLQRFGGKGGYQSSGPIIAELSPEQKRTIALQNQYLESTAPVLSSLVQYGSNALKEYGAPDFTKYYNEGLSRALDAANMTQDLASGKMPSSYQAGINQAVTDAVAPYQQQFGRMGGDGTINSSLLRSLTTDMSRGATAAANTMFNQNMSTASQLAGAYGSSALAPLNFQTAAYNAQTQPAKDFLTLGTQTYQPTGQAANQAYQWQAALSAPAQNNYVQQPGFGSVLGSIAGGLAGNAGLFCFPADTLVWLNDGDLPIVDIKVGDKVETIVNGDIVETEVLEKTETVADTVYARFGKLKEVECTVSQVFRMADGSTRAVSDMQAGDMVETVYGELPFVTAIPAQSQIPVYELRTDKTFFLVGVGGFVTEGWRENEVAG